MRLKNLNKNINVTLNKIKIKFDFKNINLYFETNNPKVIFLDSSIPVEKIKVYLNLKKLLKIKKILMKFRLTLKKLTMKILMD